MMNNIFEYSFNLTEQFIAVMDNSMCITKANSALLEILGISEDEIIGMPYWELPIWKDDFEFQNKLMFACEHIYMGEEVKFEAKYLNAEAEARNIEFTIKAVYVGEEIDGLLAMGYDVTEIKKAQKELFNLEKEVSAFFDVGVDGYFIRSLDEGICLLEENFDDIFYETLEKGKMIKKNKALEKILELPEDEDLAEVLKNNPLDLSLNTIKEYWIKMIENGHFRFETYFISKDYGKKYVEITMVALIDRNRYMGCSVTVKDISPSKEYENKLFYMANYDALTSVSNRRYFMNRVNDILEKKYDMDMSIVMFDIDFFKKVNDEYGHDIGDIALIEVAKAIEKTIGDLGIFARMGGEEFAAILFIDTCASKSILEMILNNIRSLEIKSEDIKFKLTISAGISKILKGQSLNNALKNADKALYEAKNSGRDKYCEYP